MSVLKEVREALRAELASWDLGVTGLDWRGDVHPPKTDAPTDKPDDAQHSLPMAGVGMPRFTYQDEDEPVIIAQANDTYGAIMYSGDAEATCEVSIWLETQADYDAVVANFDRYWKWRAYDTAAAGVGLAIPVTLLGTSQEIRAYLIGEVTPASFVMVSSRDTYMIKWAVLLKFPDLVEELPTARHGVQYIRIRLNGGDTFGPGEYYALQVEQDETDLELETGESFEPEDGSLPEPDTLTLENGLPLLLEDGDTIELEAA